MPVTIFEARDSLGGVVRHVIPEFRIASDDISHDAELCLAFGAKVQLNARVDSIDELKAQGFTDVVVATGAWMPGSAGLSWASTSWSLALATPPWMPPAWPSAWPA